MFSTFVNCLVQLLESGTLSMKSDCSMSGPLKMAVGLKRFFSYSVGLKSLSYIIFSLNSVYFLVFNSLGKKWFFLVFCSFPLFISLSYTYSLSLSLCLLAHYCYSSLSLSSSIWHARREQRLILNGPRYSGQPLGIGDFLVRANIN